MSQIEKKGRNQIAHELDIGQGTVSNILKDFKKRQQESNVPEHLNKGDTTFPEESLQEREFKNNKGISIENHKITNTQDFEENGYPIAPANGSPLNWFINGFEGAINNKPPKVINPSEESLHTPTMGSPTSTAPNGIGRPISDRNLLIIDPEINIEPDDTINQDVTKQDDKIEGTQDKRFGYQPTITLPDFKNQGSSIDSDSDDPPIILDMDWDSDESWQRRLVKAWSERAQQIKLIEVGRKQLQEEREQLESMRETVRLRINDLKAREAKVAEVELLIPLSKQLQMMKVDVRNFIPWSEIVQKYAETHNTDLTTAAFDIKRELEEYGELQFIKKEIKKAEAYWSALCDSIRGKEAAVKTVMKLRALGYTEGSMKKLMGIVKDGRGYRKLDTELFDVGGKNGTLKEDVSNGASPDNNGYNGPSMSDWIRLNLLKQNTTRQLNKMANQ